MSCEAEPGSAGLPPGEFGEGRVFPNYAIHRVLHSVSGLFDVPGLSGAFPREPPIRNLPPRPSLSA